MIMVSSIAWAQASKYSSPLISETKLVGEISFVNIKAEFRNVRVIQASFLGLGQYAGRFGFGGYLFRYNSITEGYDKYCMEYGIWEFLPFRISYVPFFKKGEYWHQRYHPENERLLFWDSVSPGKYAKFYIRLFGDASFIKFLSRWRDPMTIAEYVPGTEHGIITWNKYRKIGKMYPPTLSAGIQISYTIVSLEAGYTYQTDRWYEFYKQGLILKPEGFTFTGPFISANLNLGAILTRSALSNF
jgi:hypothetical protein